MQTARSFSRPVLILISLVISFGILASAISNFLVTVSPALAVKINPLNTQARINLLTSSLSVETNAAEQRNLKAVVENGIALNPIDARLFSFLGIIENRQGNASKAQQFFLHTLKILPTEILALSRRFDFNIKDGNYVQSVSIADVILRRWPRHWKVIAPYMAPMLRDNAAYAEARKRFSKYELGKNWLVAALVKDSDATFLAYRLLLDWKGLGVTNLRKEINLVTKRMISYGQYTRAYRLFISTLSSAEESESGYVFNKNFNINPTGNLFDWNLINRAGMSEQITDVAVRSASNKVTRQRVLEIKFLDAPVRFSQVLQHLYLPASSFTVNLVYSTQSLKSVNPISISLECQKSNRVLATFELKSGDNKSTELQTSFKVPENDCELQRLRVSNGNFVDSWKNRYSGAVRLHSVTINLAGV